MAREKSATPRAEEVIFVTGSKPDDYTIRCKVPAWFEFDLLITRDFPAACAIVAALRGLYKARIDRLTRRSTKTKEG
jgi:hypothetical protein